MVQQVIYTQISAIPSGLHQQIVDFLRMEWSDGFIGKNRLRNWAHKEKHHPVIFVLVEQDILISHVAVVWRYITHKDITYKVYALSGMLTYPQFRKQGYGRKLVQAAKEYMLKIDADIIMVHTHLKGFYEKAGFEPLPKVITLFGDPQKPKQSEDSAFGLFLSDKGKQGRKDFESEPFYFYLRI